VQLEAPVSPEYVPIASKCAQYQTAIATVYGKARSNQSAPESHSVHESPVKPARGWYCPAMQAAQRQPEHGSYCPAGQPLLTGSGVGDSPPTQNEEPADEVVESAHGVHAVDASWNRAKALHAQN